MKFEVKSKDVFDELDDLEVVVAWNKTKQAFTIKYNTKNRVSLKEAVPTSTPVSLVFSQGEGMSATVLSTRLLTKPKRRSRGRRASRSPSSCPANQAILYYNTLLLNN
jgi:hypothetical protein